MEETKLAGNPKSGQCSTRKRKNGKLQIELSSTAFLLSHGSRLSIDK